LGIESRVQSLKNQHAQALEKKYKAEAHKDAAEAAKNEALSLLKETWGIDTLDEARTLIREKHRALEALLEEAEAQLKNA
jgi:hypothetical protein